jgi:peptidoglycan/xylan/chitin deacetylase (PgdA/CDA1 family)
MVGRRFARLIAPLERRMWPGAPVVLMYHRVAAPADDPWGLSVPPDVFASQIEALKRVRRVLPLADLVVRLRDGAGLREPLAAVTFDDGYHDAYTAARPILHQLDCPATVFVTTAMIGSNREFWWDELARIVLGSPSLPPSLGAGSAPDGAARRKLCWAVRRELRHQSPAEIDRRLEALSAEAGLDRAARPDHRAMTGEEVAALSDGLITIGAHTLNHPSLPHLPPVDRQAEVGQSRRACEALAGAPVEQFAYPFGYYDGPSVGAVRRAGFTLACTTVASVARRGSDPLRLPRQNPGRRGPEDLVKMLAGG